MATAPRPPAHFTPVPVRARHDGWTAERQIAFVEKLADTGGITAACKHVGMSRESVRKLRRRPCGQAFRNACDAALDVAYGELEEAALERARDGVSRPIFFNGEQVGEQRHFDERLTMFLLRFRRCHRFGDEAQAPVRPPAAIPGSDQEELIPFDPEQAVEGGLVGIEFPSDVPPDEEEPDSYSGSEG